MRKTRSGRRSQQTDRQIDHADGEINGTLLSEVAVLRVGMIPLRQFLALLDGLVLETYSLVIHVRAYLILYRDFGATKEFGRVVLVSVMRRVRSGMWDEAYNLQVPDFDLEAKLVLSMLWLPNGQVCG